MPRERVNVQFRLGPPGSSAAVEVALRSYGERWTASATSHTGTTGIGLGSSAREALVSALDAVRPHAARAFLVDLALLAPSVEIVRQERAMGA
jgi:hypothetical protein